MAAETERRSVIGVRLMAVVMMLAANEAVLVLVSGQTKCNVNLQSAMAQCTAYVQKLGPQVDPSQGCCDVIKGVDVGCACGMVTPEMEVLISIPKAVHVVQFCGVEVPHGTKCGSYTIP